MTFSRKIDRSCYRKALCALSVQDYRTSGSPGNQLHHANLVSPALYMAATIIITITINVHAAMPMPNIKTMSL